ncbi:hypothetical protein SS50377_25851 [Spironucleus salmonicida]|uniref:Uncharacterized protein n=1 Tax=Spironucleus salmonicida TaxID=348837 RepID=V6LMK6_9EUKA|nr:hypothetical protein SS50377_25851 [Spironucleus salmonicida]|eukprot:EST45443.1 Hypothetical protein SS50377_14636 [Spironucleus salmonicida]
MGNCVSHQDDSMHVIPDESSDNEQVHQVRQSIEIAPVRTYSIRQSMEEIEIFQRGEVNDIIQNRLSISRQSFECSNCNLMPTSTTAQPSTLSIKTFLLPDVYLEQEDEED